MAEEPKPPAGLAVGGRALWRQIVRAAAEEDQELSALEQRHLLSACWSRGQYRGGRTIQEPSMHRTSSPTAGIHRR